MRYGIGVGAMILSVLLAGCGSPESSIKESCIRDGGPSGDKGLKAEEVNTQCACFASKLKESLTDEQLDKVAKVMAMPEKDREAAAKDLPMVTLTAIMGAGKSCASAPAS